MSVVGFPTKKTATETSEHVPLHIPMLGIASYPEYAGIDFERAQQRFLLASGVVIPQTVEQKVQAERDKVRYAALVDLDLPCDEEQICSFERIDAFVLAVTSYPRHWLAAWNYRQHVECVKHSPGPDAQDLIDFGYAAAISVIS